LNAAIELDIDADLRKGHQRFQKQAKKKRKNLTTV
jgi:hypothetical protein